MGEDSTQDQVARQIREELEESGRSFRSMLASLSEADWRAASRNPAWTNGQVVYHILFAFLLIPALFWMIRFWSRLPDRFSKAFARILDAFTPLFNRVNAFGPKGQAAVFGRRRAGPLFERIQRSILRKVDSLSGEEWCAGMHYPQRWDTDFGDYMTFRDLFHYPSVHLRKHLRQISADRAD